MAHTLKLRARSSSPAAAAALFFGRRSFFLNTALAFCLCTILLYQSGSKYQENIQRSFRLPKPTSTYYLEDLPEEELNSTAKVDDDPNIWVTMGLCWSSNTKYYDKDKFPYVESAPMAAKLWRKFTRARVILQVVHTEPTPPPALLSYKTSLESDADAVVVLLPASDEADMDCALQAQLVRIVVPHKMKDLIKPNDIVVTADVDAFVTSSDIQLPLTKLKHKKMWLYRYGKSLVTGCTFMMPFIGARARVWTEIIEFDGSLRGMVRKYGEYMKFDEDYTWESDQNIVTHSILKSGVCSLPGNHSLWSTLNLEPNPVNDSQTCWHGGAAYEDCNNKLWHRNLGIRYYGGGCKWWHFYPDERLPDLESKFDEIYSGRFGNTVASALVGGARSVLGTEWLKWAFS